MYDYLIVGAGLSGAIFNMKLLNVVKKVKVIDKRDHIVEISTARRLKRINVHKYGAHFPYVQQVWDYVNQFR